MSIKSEQNRKMEGFWKKELPTVDKIWLKLDLIDEMAEVYERNKLRKGEEGCL